MTSDIVGAVWEGCRENQKHFLTSVCLCSWRGGVLLAEHERADAKGCGADTAIYTEPGCRVHGSHGESLRGFLYVLVRKVDEEQSNSGGPNVVERLRETVSGQFELSARHIGRSFHGKEPRYGDAGNWRLLRGVHE